jgi:alkanesulfonate monooxygenase SsuD/methylene tetrahydromethanopterin reductase-like flavin-dependent oxidoreductase (luciferase family)
VSGRPVGLVLGSAIAPERLPRLARMAEQLGFAELWLAEDYFFTGGISCATAALAATERVPVGLGVVSAMTRHPALLAMEVATLERLHPGRVRAGIGLGVPAWLRQMGLMPKSSLTAIRECVTAVRRLLAGDELTHDGRSFRFDRVSLTYPPSEPVPIYTGAVGPKMLELSGEIADGSVLSVLAGADYIRWARERIAAGSRDGERRIAAFAFFSVGEDGAAAKEALRDPVAFYLAAGGRNTLTDAAGISDDLDALLANGGADAVARDMPAAWLDRLTVAGTPAECAAAIRRLLEAGADSVVLFPMPSDRCEEMVGAAAADVLPRLAS